MRTLITGLEDAFLAFGGVPQELLFDQTMAYTAAALGAAAVWPTIEPYVITLLKESFRSP